MPRGLSTEALDRVAGGLNPQPLPPGIRSSPRIRCRRIYSKALTSPAVTDEARSEPIA